MKETDHFIRWNDIDETFVITDKEEFSSLLPKYFKTKNFTSFIRQLNMYNFVRVKNREKHHEFRNRYFRKGAYREMAKIKRRPVHSAKKPNGLNKNYSNNDLSFKINGNICGNGFFDLKGGDLSAIQIHNKNSLNELKLVFLDFYRILKGDGLRKKEMLKEELVKLLAECGLDSLNDQSVFGLVEISKKLVIENYNTEFGERLKKMWLSCFFGEKVEVKDIFSSCGKGGGVERRNNQIEIEDNSYLKIENRHDVPGLFVNKYEIERVPKKNFDFKSISSIIVVPRVIRKSNTISQVRNIQFRDFRDFLKARRIK